MNCRNEEQPCGKQDCEIRICAKEKGFVTCMECGDYKECGKFDFLKKDIVMGLLEFWMKPEEKATIGV